MIILGLGGILSDAACALLRDGELVAAVEEKKIAAALYGGRSAGAGDRRLPSDRQVKPEQVDCVAVGAAVRAAGDSVHLQIARAVSEARFAVVEHHTAHAASAYFLVAFDEATVLTLDRGGRFSCGARWRATGLSLQLEKELYFPDSFGDLYGRVTELLGFERMPMSTRSVALDGWRRPVRCAVRIDDRCGRATTGLASTGRVSRITSASRRLRCEAVPGLGSTADAPFRRS